MGLLMNTAHGTIQLHTGGWTVTCVVWTVTSVGGGFGALWHEQSSGWQQTCQDGLYFKPKVETTKIRLSHLFSRAIPSGPVLGVIAGDCSPLGESRALNVGVAVSPSNDCSKLLTSSRSFSLPSTLG
jgi:hypothetical protein